MHVIASFEHSAFLELAINRLQQNGIKKEDIVAVPMDELMDPPQVFDTIHRADGTSLLDLAAILATVFSVLGATFGFQMRWGPIIWGLFGFVFGAVLGFMIDRLNTKKRRTTPVQFNTEVVLIILCQETELQAIKAILKEFMAQRIGILQI